MGWNEVRQVAPHALWEGIADGSRFYFVHSYYCGAADRALIAAARPTTATPFTSAVARDNIFATQFHPEKSAVRGPHATSQLRRLEIPEVLSPEHLPCSSSPRST